jgi:hypothetical protein
MKNEITSEVLTEFKERMKLNDDEDKTLIRILKASVEDLIDKCGDYDLHTSERFKELVFERSRYVYNDAIEYFNDNFLSQLVTLGISKVLNEIVLEGDSDATV